MLTGKLPDGSDGSAELAGMAHSAATEGVPTIGGIAGRSKGKAMYEKGSAGCDDDEGGDNNKGGSGGEADTWDNGGS